MNTSWFTQLPTILVALTLEVAGLIAIWGLFDAKLKARNKEKDELEERITKLYQEEISGLTKKMNAQADDIKNTQADVLRLTGENKLMRELLTGQDKDTQAWRGRTEQSMVLIQEMSKFSLLNGKKTDAAIKGIEKVGRHVERLALAIEKTVK
jgi:predicted transcriptional regulator